MGSPALSLHRPVPPQSAQGLPGRRLHFPSKSSLLLLSLVFPDPKAICLSVCLQLTFLSLSLVFPPCHSLSPLRTSSARHFCTLLHLLLSLAPPILPSPLVHGGKGTRFTLSEDIYPEKGTCCAARPPPAPLPARLVKGPSSRLPGKQGRLAGSTRGRDVSSQAWGPRQAQEIKSWTQVPAQPSGTLFLSKMGTDQTLVCRVIVSNSWHMMDPQQSSVSIVCQRKKPTCVRLQLAHTLCQVFLGRSQKPPYKQGRWPVIPGGRVPSQGQPGPHGQTLG